MSIIENHDIVQMGLNIQAEKERCKKIIGEKNDWQEIPSDQREKLLSSQRAQLITADRKNISLTMDHMILDKKEFKDVLPIVPKTVEIFFDSFPKISSCAFVWLIS